MSKVEMKNWVLLYHIKGAGADYGLVLQSQAAKILSSEELINLPHGKPSSWAYFHVCSKNIDDRGYTCCEKILCLNRNRDTGQKTEKKIESQNQPCTFLKIFIFNLIILWLKKKEPNNFIFFIYELHFIKENMSV